MTSPWYQYVLNHFSPKCEMYSMFLNLNLNDVIPQERAW